MSKQAKSGWTRDLCVFSGFPIYPGHGRRFVPFMCSSTRPVLPVFSKKCGSFLRRGTRPRLVNWTVFFRREHKKGGFKDIKRRKRVVKVKKVARSYIGASIETIEQKKATLSAKTKTQVDKEKDAKAARAEAARARAKAAGLGGKSGVFAKHAGKGR
eukprot:TRINITY_DN32695_c0_g1_i1.p1 TRINITY_DN32695_c0_g1~~TRINITY_DN32695_c0_g1_i1.p1  ORF type:complete len:157 (-),score=35.27 TRINITY_DN32695_c0_g1_i1:304-774(-)